MTSHTIGTWTFTLTPGRRYLASRPMMESRGQPLLVTILDITDGYPGTGAAYPVGPLTYDAANDLLNAFNDGPVSFAGRIWE